MAENLSLAFANTAEWHAGPKPEERLRSYAGAVGWGQRQGIISEAQGRELLAKAAASPEEETAALKRIIALREAVYHILSAVSHRKPPESADLETLNAELTQALPHLRLVATEEGERDDGPRAGGGLPGFAWVWTGLEDHLTSLLWPVAKDATDLLMSSQLVQVRECADESCGWLFLDLSKNASRRWCNMADCGNRAKAKRYRARKKASVEGGGTGRA